MKNLALNPARRYALSWLLLLLHLAVPAAGLACALAVPDRECGAQCCRSGKGSCCRRKPPTGPAVSAVHCPPECGRLPAFPHSAAGEARAAKGFVHELIAQPGASPFAPALRTSALLCFALCQRPPPAGENSL